MLRPQPIDTMYIYSKPDEPHPGNIQDTERDSAHQEQLRPPSPRPTTRPLHPRPTPPHISQPPSSTSTSKCRRSSFPVSFPFPPLFQANTSSTSLASSTAEGKPIPLDNTTTAHRTSALQKLNSTYPSQVRRHRYAKSAGAQSSTYSQPVLVRTYTGLPPAQISQGARGLRYRLSSGSRGGSRRVPLPASSRQSTVNLSGGPIQPALSGTGTAYAGSTNANPVNEENERRIVGLTMPRPKSKKSSSKLPLSLPLSIHLPVPWQWQSSSPPHPDNDDTKLPPLEAFSFKSILADMQTRGDGGSISADLDRIAEICARSRYSLSNQYEVHVAPHGSGESFTTSGRSSGGHRRRGHCHGVAGPTLQAFNSDDDESAATRSHRQRRSGGGRRKSVAYGTLETIMSSSRSSEEDKSKKKPAAEIASQVRGRASRKNWGSSTASGSKSTSTVNPETESQGGGAHDSSSTNPDPKDMLARKKSFSFATAIIDSGRSVGRNEAASSLVSEPALPQTSNTNLGVRTTLAGSEGCSQGSRSASPNERIEVQLADELPHQEGSTVSGGNIRPWSSWIPWRTESMGDTEVSSHSQGTPSHAEGSLRQLLRSVDVTSDKGKQSTGQPD